MRPECGEHRSLASWHLALGGAAAAFLLIAAAPPHLAPDPRPVVVRDVGYVVNARVRPVFFWVTRNDVGRARLTWRQYAEGAIGFELFIGTDAARAPSRISRWTWVVEAPSASGAEVAIVTRDTGARTFAEAEAAAAREAGGAFDVDVFRVSIDAGQAVSRSERRRLPRDPRTGDLASVLAAPAIGPTATGAVAVPPHAQPGFVTALTSLMIATQRECRAQTASPRRPGAATVPYLYKAQVYDMTMRICRFQLQRAVGSRTFEALIEADIGIRNRGTGATTALDLTFGTEGPLAAIPVRAVFRPHWWIEVELVLDEDGPS